MPFPRNFINGKVPKDIVEEAKKRHNQRSLKSFRDFRTDIASAQSTSLLNSLGSVVGLPRNSFLERIASIGEYVNPRKVPVVSVIEANINLLTDYMDHGGGHPKYVGTIQKTEALRQLSEIANTPTKLPDFESWTRVHTSSLHNALIFCLNIDNTSIVEEACIAITILARKLGFNMLKGAEQLVTGLVTALAVAMGPTESHTEQLRKALDFHAEIEMAKARPLEFHYPRVDYELEEPKFRTIGYIYFALADLFMSLPHPFLIHYFVCRILRRKEMTRTYLFKIFFAICDNLAELEERAREMCPHIDKPKPQKEEKPAQKRVFNALSFPTTSTLQMDAKAASNKPGTSGKDTATRDNDDESSESWMYKPDMYRKELWESLPQKLYTEMMRIYSDRNQENQNLIVNIMTVLRSISSVKLPLFDENMFHKLEFLNLDVAEKGKHIRIATPKVSEAVQQPVTNPETPKVTEQFKPETELIPPVEKVPRTSDVASADEVKTNSGGSLSVPSSYQSDSDAIKNINRPTVLLPRLPDINKINL